MLKLLTNERLYHVSRNLPYSPFPLLEPGHSFEVGKTRNPFFDFYFNNARTYSVLDNGAWLQVPALTFLRAVKDGRVTPSKLPADAFEIAQHFMMLSRELLWESVRLSDFPTAPSRQRGLWCTSDVDMLAHWAQRLRTDGVEFRCVELCASGRVLKCDAAWLMGDSELLSQSTEKAQKYWTGMISDTNPEPELLFEGHLTVLKEIIL